MILCLSCAHPLAKSPEIIEPVIYPAPPAPTRLQFLTSISHSGDISGPQGKFNEFLFGKQEPLPVVKPYGINVQYPKIYVCDPGIKGLEIIDLESKSFEYFIPGGLGALQLPLNCCIDETGILYVADAGRKQVVVFSAERTFLHAFSLEDDAKPTDLSVDNSGLWVTAIDRHRVLHYSSDDYRLLASFPDVKTGNPAYLYQPVGITLGDSLVYVSDVGGCRVTVFDKNYRYIQTIGSPGNGFGQFTRPKGISTDRSGLVYVVDAAFENTQLFDRNGELLLHFGGTRTGPGGMWLPAGIAVDSSCNSYFQPLVDEHFTLNYLVFVVNQYGPDKINVYGFVNPVIRQQP